MNIGIITINYGTNYGSSAQVYALYKKIQEMKPEAKITVINYIPKRYNFRNRYLSTNKDLSGLGKIVYLLGSAPLKYLNENKFISFQKKYTALSKRIYTEQKAKKLCGGYDALITGSDQVWNSDYNKGFDPMYFLSFSSNYSTKFSYAASCGKDSYNIDEWAQMDRYLKTFAFLSVREKSTYEMFKEKGFTKCKLVLDPSFFISKEGWEELAIPPRKLIKNYLLIYCLDDDESNLITIAKKIAYEKGLKTAIVVYGHVWSKYDADITLRNQTPEQFFWLINHAEFVVTNSFHGVAFSINLEKQFVAVKRKKFNNRLDSILSIFNLTNRYMTINSDTKSILEIDYSLIRSIKQEWIRTSERFLKDALNRV